MAPLETWAAGLAVGDLPADIVRLARLQLAAGPGYPDGVLGASVSAPDPTGTVDDWVVATVAHNETAGRRGLASRLGDAAANGLGTVWLTRTLRLAAMAGPPGTDVALEAVNAILQRHIKASEKRLRADQVERVEVRLGWPAWDRVRDAGAVAQLVGRLVVAHELTPATLADSSRMDEVEAVAATVTVSHEWSATLRTADAFAASLAPLLVGGIAPTIGWSALRASGTRDAVDFRSLARVRPRGLAKLLTTRRGTLADCDLGRWRWEEPVQVKLYTTRGGWWPDRRSGPTGTGEGLEGVVRARGGDVELAVATPGTAPALDLRGGRPWRP